MQEPTPLSQKGAASQVLHSGRQLVVDLLDYKGVGPFLQRHYKTIGASAVAALMAGGLYLYFSEPVYTAQAQILIDPGLPNVLRDQSIEAPPTMDSQQVETEMAVLRSEEVSSAVVDRFNLGDDPEFGVRYLSDYLPSWAVSGATLAKIEAEKPRAVLAKFRRNLVVHRIGVSYAVDVFYTSSNPDQAAQIANGVADAYMRFQTDTRANAARIGSQWLEQRLGELRHEMNAAARKMQEYRVRQDYSISGKAERVLPAISKPASMSPPVEPGQAAKVESETVAEEPLTFEDLESTASTYRRIYENYLQSFMTAVQRQSFPISNARVITKATRPLTPSRSSGFILLLALVLGGMIGAGFGFLSDRAQGENKRTI